MHTFWRPRKHTCIRRIVRIEKYREPYWCPVNLKLVYLSQDKSSRSGTSIVIWTLQLWTALTSDLQCANPPKTGSLFIWRLVNDAWNSDRIPKMWSCGNNMFRLAHFMVCRCVNIPAKSKRHPGLRKLRKLFYYYCWSVIIALSAHSKM